MLARDFLSTLLKSSPESIMALKSSPGIAPNLISIKSCWSSLAKSKFASAIRLKSSAGTDLKSIFAISFWSNRSNFKPESLSIPKSSLGTFPKSILSISFWSNDSNLIFPSAKITRFSLGNLPKSILSISFWSNWSNFLPKSTWSLRSLPEVFCRSLAANFGVDSGSGRIGKFSFCSSIRILFSSTFWAISSCTLSVFALSFSVWRSCEALVLSMEFLVSLREGFKITSSGSMPKSVSTSPKTGRSYILKLGSSGSNMLLNEPLPLKFKFDPPPMKPNSSKLCWYSASISGLIIELVASISPTLASNSQSPSFPVVSTEARTSAAVIWLTDLIKAWPSSPEAISQL